MVDIENLNKDEKIFLKEFQIFNNALKINQSSTDEVNFGILKSSYNNLIEDYYHLLKQAVKLVKISDSTQLKLRNAQILLKEQNEKIEHANLLIANEKEKSEKLLLNILPIKIADRLKSGEELIADYFDEASVIFVDLAGFTKYSSKTSPSKIVNMLNHIFIEFDKISSKYGIEKIKTIGDCYMAASGIPEKNPEHAVNIAKMATEIQHFMADYQTNEGYDIRARIGLHCGPVVAGIIGRQKFIYDLWGDTVNIASRMESSGVIGKIQCTERFKKKIEEIPLIHPLSNGENRAGGFHFEERGEIEINGLGMMRTYFLNAEL